MTDPATLLGIDPDDPLTRRGRALIAADAALLDALVARRQALGLTAAGVAARMEVDTQTVTDLEAGASDPTLSTLRRYAMALGVVVTHTVTPDTP